jgi:hypothetical protein
MVKEVGSEILGISSIFLKNLEGWYFEIFIEETTMAEKALSRSSSRGSIFPLPVPSSITDQPIT